MAFDAARQPGSAKQLIVLSWLVAIPFMVLMGWLGYKGITSDCPGAGIEPSYAKCDSRQRPSMMWVEPISTETLAGKTRLAAKAYEAHWSSRGTYTPEEVEELRRGQNPRIVSALRWATDDQLDQVAVVECDALGAADSAKDFMNDKRLGRGARHQRLHLIEAVVPVYCPEHNAIMAQVVELG